MFGLTNRSVSSLRKKADNIVSVFSKTLNETANLNKEIEISISEKQEMIQEITKDVNELESIKNSNNKLIEKLENFLA
jgi:hypothetical protein